MGQYKRAEENDIKAKMKPLFPDDVEMICISKDDYDRLYGDLTYENIELQDRINRAIHLIQLLQMDGKVEIKDLGNIVRILQGKEK